MGATSSAHSKPAPVQLPSQSSASGFGLPSKLAAAGRTEARQVARWQQTLHQPGADPQDLQAAARGVRDLRNELRGSRDTAADAALTDLGLLQLSVAEFESRWPSDTALGALPGGVSIGYLSRTQLERVLLQVGAKTPSAAVTDALWKLLKDAKGAKSGHVSVRATHVALLMLCGGRGVAAERLRAAWRAWDNVGDGSELGMNAHGMVWTELIEMLSVMQASLGPLDESVVEQLEAAIPPVVTLALTHWHTDTDTGTDTDTLVHWR